MKKKITKEDIDFLLFRFLESVYLFEQTEREHFDITWQEVYLLQLLIKEGKKTISTIAKQLRLALFKASRLVTRLENKGYITRHKDNNDQRIIYISITKEGTQIVGKVESYNYSTIVSNLHLIPERELDGMVDAISKIKLLLNLEERKDK